MASTVYHTPKASALAAPHFAPPKRHPSPSKAFRYRRTVHPGELSDIISSPAVTPLQKDLASRVAKAADQLRQWCEEIEQWNWTGSFELPAEELDACRDRLNTISEQLTRISVDDLKEHVLGIHMSRSRPSSSQSLQSMPTLHFMDDYELFVTQTLVQALPNLALLNHFLRTWSVRVLVLREVPIFLSQLASYRQRLSAAFDTSREPAGPATPPHALDLLRNNIKASQHELETTIQDAGTRLDAMLDTLEGSDDCLPDAWIDEYENLESEHGKWSAEAEARLLQIEVLKQHVADLDSPTPTPSPTVRTTTKSSLDTDASTSGEATSASSLVEEIAGTRTGLINAEELESKAMATGDALDFTPSGGEQQNGAASLPTQDNDNDANSEDISVVRRASVQSVSSFQRSQLKTLDVKRSSSKASSSTVQSLASIEQNSSPPVSPTSPVSASKRQSWFTQPTSPLTMTVENASNEPGNRSSVLREADDEKLENSEFGTDDDPVATPARRRSSSFDSSPFDISTPVDDSPSASRLLAKAPRPPLNSLIPKRRIHTNFSSIASSPPSASSTPPSPSNVAKSPTTSRIPLQQQISAIISEIHAPIRLASSPTTDAPSATSTQTAPTTPPTQKPAKFRRFPSLRPHLHPARAVTSPTPSTLPTLTLAPASAADANRAGATDPEIKLYHLHGREGKPIKLFVRRIGENGERVMVRVGGGWADLREYLRVYVEHHGSATKRGVSEGRVEVFGLGDGQDGGRGSGSVTSSPLARLEASEFGDGGLSEGFDSPASVEGTPSPALGFVDVADGVGSEASSRKVSAGSQWNDGGRSLAGPAVRKTEMSEEKRDWVEGIVEQARKLHASGVGGKKGGAKRVFLKGARE